MPERKVVRSGPAPVVLDGIALTEDGGPLYAQIADAVRAAISGGRLRTGDRLPAERDLAVQLGVSRVTVRQAMNRLERHGLVERTVGRTGGTFVAEPKIERDLSHYAGLADQLERQQIDVAARVLSAGVRTASPAIAGALGLPAASPVYEIVRVRLANGRPVALEHTNYSTSRYPGLLEHPLDGSTYAILRAHYGGAPERAVEYLEPMAAGPEEAEALDVPAGTPLLHVERIGYDAGGAPVEFSREVFRGDRTRMVVWSSERR